MLEPLDDDVLEDAPAAGVALAAEGELLVDLSGHPAPDVGVEPDVPDLDTLIVENVDVVVPSLPMGEIDFAIAIGSGLPVAHPVVVDVHFVDDGHLLFPPYQMVKGLLP